MNKTFIIVLAILVALAQGENTTVGLPRNRLGIDTCLAPNEWIASPNGLARFGVESYGALSLRCPDRLVWSAPPRVHNQHTRLCLQYDGNLVRTVGDGGGRYYDDGWKSGPRPTWASATDGRAYGFTWLSVWDNCTAVLTTERDEIIWSASETTVAPADPKDVHALVLLVGFMLLLSIGAQCTK
jgi:hypothetical protein